MKTSAGPFDDEPSSVPAYPPPRRMSPPNRASCLLYESVGPTRTFPLLHFVAPAALIRSHALLVPVPSARMQPRLAFPLEVPALTTLPIGKPATPRTVVTESLQAWQSVGSLAPSALSVSNTIDGN